MTMLIKMLATLPLMVLFFDYAVAMERVEPAGTRRSLRIISGQTDAGTFPTLKVNWELGVKWVD
ncbi:hypothetical protein [Rhizobium sp. L1K21]|uniref:hypothetical protein n=1 Tax=Rhizobium sp. L1K21 TaxID=2954933 RepID=UPI00209224CD|nr:hypothetical protein [Rhizobium sp. L1K21]MCO6186912.1 hypothetical protein [Rhizobium sp. L1K21]